MVSKISVRKAVREDMNDVLNMTMELAEYAKMSDRPKLTIEDLIRDGGFASDAANPIFHCFVAEVFQEATSTTPETRKNVGFALCYYSSYSAPGVRAFFMEDLYVQESYRNRGIGKLLVFEVMSFAERHGCVILDFHVFSWNPACSFYKKLGYQESKEWQCMRLDRETMDKLINI